MVNENFAAQFWPAESPVGKRLRPIDRSTPGEWRTVVGVVPNIMQGDALRENFKPLVYIPFRQESAAVAVNRDGVGFNGAYVLVRIGVPVDRVAQAVRAEVEHVDPDVILEEFTTLKASFAFNRGRMDLAHAELGKHAAVAPVLALVALLLAAMGLYAVIAHSVSQRTREIGVRMAIGARAEDIWRLVFREGMTPVIVGLTLGLVASFGVNRLLRSQLVGVSPYDPVTLATASAVLILIALLACQIPAQRALRVDPAVALRHD
jgi:putative ABC transport system permease protein